MYFHSVEAKTIKNIQLAKKDKGEGIVPVLQKRSLPAFFLRARLSRNPWNPSSFVPVCALNMLCTESGCLTVWSSLQESVS